MIRIEFDTEQFRKKKEELIQKIEDPSDLWADLAEVTIEAIESAFESKKDPFGSPWKSHSPTTVRIHGSHRLLQLSGRLRASVKAKVTPDALTIEIGAPYAAIHQWGNPRNKVFGRGLGPIPARPFLPITEDNITTRLLNKFNDIIADYYEVDE